MISKKILFIVNGLGLGNSTRCKSIMSELSSLGNEVSLITSGNGLEFFRENKSFDIVAEYKSILYGQNKNKLSVFKTILNIPVLITIFISNCRKLNKVLKSKKYDAIVFDSDYTAISLLFKKRPLLIGLNNAQIITSLISKMHISNSIKLQLMIEKLDALFHKLVPDFVISPWFNQLELAFKNTFFCPLIIRKGLVKKNHVEHPKNVLIMLSGSQFGTSIDLIKMLHFENLNVKMIGSSSNLKVFNNKELINQADILIINAGFSAISEAVILNIPSVVIPVENHAEQFINAQTVEKLGLGLVADQSNIQEKFDSILANYHIFKENFLKFQFASNGSFQAASKIIKLLK